MKIPSTEELIEILVEGNIHLRKMAEGMEFPWNPDISDPRKLHNNYVRNLITCYISKYSELSEAIKYSIDSQNYLVYALSGRALIEIT